MFIYWHIYVNSTFGSTISIHSMDVLIYLNHTNGIHFDVVINVDSHDEDNFINSSDETCIYLDETNPETEDVSMVRMTMHAYKFMF